MRNFSYLIPGVLAGANMPRGKEDLEYLVEQGIKILVTAMEDSLDVQMVEAVGLEYHYIPILPYGTPSLQQISAFVELVNRNRQKNRPVAVHCYMGWGRTGTLLAAYLVNEGMSASDAIDEVRKKRPGSIETGGQEQVLFILEQALAARRS
ncbi:MAG: dual specificity protein phosphatase family protein [Candidatus Hermodarchaeota archaeon]|nr:dual specificity protein phosphatase family protein [Candidatus Hermodarchaeota archaeon]